jgi:hypothetical protein
MNSPRLFVGILAIGLLLGGCAPTAQIVSTSTAPATPTGAATPEVPKPASATLSLDGLSIRDQTGSELEAAKFADPDAMLALLGKVLRSTPDPVDNGKGGLMYQWPGVMFIKNFGTGSVRITGTDVGGLPLTTTQGIHVGSTRADVMALNPFDIAYDQNGDGVSDNFGIEQRQVPETQSLKFPGQTGTAFISVSLQSDVVVSIGSPSGDYLDI